MTSARAPWSAAAAAALVLLAASCVPLPPPGTPLPPPVTRSGEGVPGRAEPARLDREPTIDVGLAWDRDSLDVDLLGPGVPITNFSSLHGGPARVRLTSAGMSIRPRGGNSWSSDIGSADTLWLGSGKQPATGAAMRWDGKTWRGTFKIFVNPRGKLTLAVRLPLETYLLGVVPGEIGGLSEQLLEAGKAQAIAARSYTLFYHGRRAAEGFDLYGTVEDQVYGPVESERPLATRCVEETRGRFALSDGRPIRANYCSTCGGITSEVWEGWPATAFPYLVSHLDRGSGDWCVGSPSYRWREEWTAAEFAANLTRFGPAQKVALPKAGVGEIVDVSAERRSRSGRVWRLVVSTTTGEIAIPAYSLRQVLRRAGNPTAILRSNLFKIDVRRDPRTRRAISVVASGAGSGHGVGLCQTGALGMARAGKKADEILEHYYPGARLERLY